MPPHFLHDGNYIIAQKSPNFSVWEIQACAVESLLALTLLYNAGVGGIAGVSNSFSTT